MDRDISGYYPLTSTPSPHYISLSPFLCSRLIYKRVRGTKSGQSYLSNNLCVSLCCFRPRELFSIVLNKRHHCLLDRLSGEIPPQLPSLWVIELFILEEKMKKSYLFKVGNHSRKLAHKKKSELHPFVKSAY